MGFTKYTTSKEKDRLRINEAIRAREMRVVGPEGENFGVMSVMLGDGPFAAVGSFPGRKNREQMFPI